MYKLHIANKNYSSWSLRPWVMMKMVGLQFEECFHVFSEQDTNREEFQKFSPSALVPCLDDQGESVWESLAIMEYLAERHDGVWPLDAKARSFARSASSEMHAGFFALRDNCPMCVGIRLKLNIISEGLQQDLQRLDQLWQDGLNRFGGPFLAGKAFSAVDAMFCPVAFRVQSYDLKLSRTSLGYVRHLLELSPMQDWYQQGLAESYREGGHEDEIASLGEIIEDFRL